MKIKDDREIFRLASEARLAVCDEVGLLLDGMKPIGRGVPYSIKASWARLVAAIRASKPKKARGGRV